MSVTRTLRAKWHAAVTLGQFMAWFRNWREIWRCHRTGRPLPPLQLRGGLEIHHRPTDDVVALFQEIFVHRLYSLGGFYKPNPRDAVLDLGANIGMFALWLQSQARGIRVHCHEPFADNAARLQRNIEINRLEDTITVARSAVAGRAGFARLGVGADDVSHSLRAEPGGATVEVECVTLEQAVEAMGAPRVALLKMDIEGAEAEVVEGASRDVWSRLDRVVFEFHERVTPDCRRRVEAVLKDHGFNDCRLAREYPSHGVGIVQARRRG